MPDFDALGGLQFSTIVLRRRITRRRVADIGYRRLFRVRQRVAAFNRRRQCECILDASINELFELNTTALR